jgi:hypothetical protein
MTFEKPLDKYGFMEKISRIILSARNSMILSSIIIRIAISDLIIIESRNFMWAMGEAHSEEITR